MPTYTITDQQSGRKIRVTGDSPPSETELEELFAGGQQATPQAPQATPERTWGDTIADALPWAGGAVGGAVGGIGGAAFGMGVGGVPGAMGGATLGGGAGEAAKQLFNRARGAAAPSSMGEAATDIGTTAATEGALAGAFGAAGKYGVPIIKGVVKNLPGSSMVKGVGREFEARRIKVASRQALGSGRLNTGRVDKLDDVLMEALDEARAGSAPSRVGGAGSPLRSKNNLPVVNPERTSGMVSTQPDKWGATSIHQADDFVDRSRLVDQARPINTAARESAFTRGSAAQSRRLPQEQALMDELLRSGRVQPEGLTQAGQSMLSPDEVSMFENALRELRSGSLNRAQSLSPRMGPR